LSDPNAYKLAPTDSDNTMTTSTACAFDQMATAAKASGVTITIASGFRTIARQQYFWNCYQTKKCNNGNLAAQPGSSNHGKGIALDLNSDCGKQEGEKPNCGGSKVYQWLYNNAHQYGFTRTVKTEPWHWEFRGAGVARATFS
jgi:LAS superfamily LD-carboxypeptidase LdcB